MEISKKNRINIIIKKAKTKNGVILSLEIDGEEEICEVSLKIRKSNRGYVLYFGLENKYLNRSPKFMKEIFSEIFDGIKFKEEFKNNLICEDGYFKTWIYLGDEKDVVEHFLNLQYYPKQRKIISIK